MLCKTDPPLTLRLGRSGRLERLAEVFVQAWGCRLLCATCTCRRPRPQQQAEVIGGMRLGYKYTRQHVHVIQLILSQKKEIRLGACDELFIVQSLRAGGLKCNNDFSLSAS